MPFQNGIPEDTCLNVNIPKVPYEEIKGIRSADRLRLSGKTVFSRAKTLQDDIYYWITGSW